MAKVTDDTFCRLPLRSVIHGPTNYNRGNTYSRASISDYNETVRCLLEAFPAGAHIKDINGATPLDLACESPYLEGQSQSRLKLELDLSVGPCRPHCQFGTGNWAASLHKYVYRETQTNYVDLNLEKYHSKNAC